MGSGKYNAAYWSNGGYGDFVQWWAERMLPEPHSTKQIEDAIAWSHDTDGPTVAASVRGAARRTRDRGAARPRSRGACECPVLVIHGTDDRISPFADGKALAKITGGRLETVEGRRPPPRTPASPCR